MKKETRIKLGIMLLIVLAVLTPTIIVTVFTVLAVTSWKVPSLVAAGSFVTIMLSGFICGGIFGSCNLGPFKEKKDEDNLKIP